MAVKEKRTTGSQANCPNWNVFLTLFHGIEVAKAVQFMFSCLAGNRNAPKVFYLYGDGAQGKSTICKVLEMAFGQAVAFKSFDDLKDFAKSAEAQKVRAVVVEDAPEILPMRFQTGSQIYIVVSKAAPRIQGRDLKIWKEIFVISFSKVIQNRRPLADVLKMYGAELSGIRQWAIQGKTIKKSEFQGVRA